jgi:hypothetical protein
LDHQHFGLFCQGHFDRFTSQLSRRIPAAFFLPCAFRAAIMKKDDLSALTASPQAGL